MNHLTPQAEGNLVERLIQLKLSEKQFNELARCIGEYPQNIFSNQYTNEQKAEAIVSRANQKGNYHLIDEELKKMFIPPTASINTTGINTYLAIGFGKLYQDLLSSLEKVEVTDNGQSEGFPNGSFVKHMEFKAKLRFKAKFKPSTRKLGIEQKNDNSVLQRKAKKLGFQSYRDIDIKVSQLYQEVLIEYPVEKFSPEMRLNELLKKLYLFLPEEHRKNINTTNYLYGIVFGTTAQCLIFNE
ncbi:hypothetical protein [Neobacillus niacini]|uniref:hypothetical protein n=1 Tax=Neobacillus niacini TaxID=86668 RepID=UPI0005EF7E67|nr:hypothetical protein [Neobacillus niacini]